MLPAPVSDGVLWVLSRGSHHFRRQHVGRQALQQLLNKSFKTSHKRAVKRAHTSGLWGIGIHLVIGQGCLLAPTDVAQALWPRAAERPLPGSLSHLFSPQSILFLICHGDLKILCPSTQLRNFQWLPIFSGVKPQLYSTVL